MKLYLSVLIVLFVVLSGIHITAQDDDVPFPPDPSELFADGVEIVEVEMIEYFQRQPFEDLRPNVDLESRIVCVYDDVDGTWHEIPFPDEIPADFNPWIQARGDDTYILMARGINVWFVDEDEFRLTEIGFICNIEIPAIEGQGHWVYFLDEITQQSHLCFTEDGRLSVPLPEELVWSNQFEISIQPELSPDGAWLLIGGSRMTESNEIEFIESFEVYSYHIIDEYLNYLGSIGANFQSPYAPYVGYWVTSTQSLLSYGPLPESWSKQYYGFDVTQPNSLELIVRGWLYDFNRFQWRYEYFTTESFFRWKTGSMNPESRNICNLLIYDYRGTTNYDIGYDCLGSDYINVGDDFYVTRVDGDPASTSTLTRLNIETGEMTNLFTGEIEGLMDIGGHYATLMMDDDGQIDTIDYYSDWFLIDYSIRITDLTSPRVVVVDLSTQTIVYEYMIENPSIVEEVNAYLIDCGRHCMISDISDSRNYYRDQVLITRGGIIPIQGAVSMPSPNTELIIIEDEAGIFEIKNIMTNTILPFMSAIPSNYTQSFEWLDDDTIEVVLREDLDYGEERSVDFYMRYVVRVP